MRGAFSRSFKGLFGRSVVHCEDVAPNPSLNDEVREPNALLDAADLEIQNAIRKIRTPPSFEDFSQTVSQGSVHTFDGARLQVQKQINLNSIVSQFFWMGSQAVGQSIYQYSLILVEDEKMLKVSTDMDFNIELDGKMALLKDNRLTAKLNAVISDQQGKKLRLEAGYAGDNWVGTLIFGRPENLISCAYVQSLTPSLTLGGLCHFDPSVEGGKVTNEYCGSYDDGVNTVVALKSAKQTKVSYQRIINPKRVLLTTDCTFDEAMKSTMSVSAQYSLKQSVVNLGVDSNLLLKSMVTTELSQGLSLQFSAEAQQFSEHYRFGLALTMGS